MTADRRNRSGEWRQCRPMRAVLRHGWLWGQGPNGRTIVSPRGTVFELRLQHAWFGRKLPEWQLMGN